MSGYFPVFDAEDILRVGWEIGTTTDGQFIMQSGQCPDHVAIVFNPGAYVRQEIDGTWTASGLTLVGNGTDHQPGCRSGLNREYMRTDGRYLHEDGITRPDTNTAEIISKAMAAEGVPAEVADRAIARIFSSPAGPGHGGLLDEVFTLACGHLVQVWPDHIKDVGKQLWCNQCRCPQDVVKGEDSE